MSTERTNRRCEDRRYSIHVRGSGSSPGMPKQQWDLLCLRLPEELWYRLASSVLGWWRWTSP